MVDWVVFHALTQPHLHEVAAELLFLCSRSCAPLCCSVLWPHCLNVVVDPSAIDAVGPVCVALTLMLTHLESVHAPYIFDWTAHPNLTPLQDVLCGLYVLLAEFEAPVNRLLAIAELLRALAVHLQLSRDANCACEALTLCTAPDCQLQRAVQMCGSVLWRRCWRFLPFRAATPPIGCSNTAMSGCD